MHEASAGGKAGGTLKEALATPAQWCGGNSSSRLYASLRRQAPSLTVILEGQEERGPSQGGRGHLPASEGDKGELQGRQEGRQVSYGSVG